MPVLVDASVWVQHFRRADPTLIELLSQDLVLCHPLILLELACGTPPEPRQQTLGHLQLLAQAATATPDEVRAAIEIRRWHGRGCGAVDVTLLASTLLTPRTALWTLDQRLKALADEADVDFNAQPH